MDLESNEYQALDDLLDTSTGAIRRGILSKSGSMHELGNNMAEGEEKSKRRLIYELVSPEITKISRTDSIYYYSKVWEVCLLVLIVLILLLAILFTNNGIRESVFFIRVYLATEIVATIIFTIEYVLRLWSCVEQVKNSNSFRRSVRWKIRFFWCLRGLNLVDLISLISLYIDLAAPQDDTFKGIVTIRVIRIFRVFMMEPQSNSFNRLRNVFMNKSNELILTFSVALVLVIISSTVMYYIESPHQHLNFGSILYSMYSAISISTVGYGAVVPVTNAGKMVAAVVSSLGVVLLAMLAGVISSGFIEMTTQSKSQRSQTSKISRIVNDDGEGSA